MHAVRCPEGCIATLQVVIRNFLAAVLILVPAVALAFSDTFVVLPFLNQSKATNLDWIGESISETILDTMAGEGMVALGREERQEAFRRLGIRQFTPLTRASIIKIAEALDAGQVIYGEFDLTPVSGSSQPSRGSLRITAHILDLSHLRQGPEYAEIGALEDLAALQSRLSWQTLQFLIPGTAPAESEFLEKRVAVRVDAIENYIRGLMASNADQRVRLLQQAARLDLRFSAPAFHLGVIYFQRKEYKTAAEWLQKVRAADARFHEASFLLGLCRYYSGDYPGAQTAFETVASNVPLNEVFNNLGAAQSRRGMPAALESFQKALEGDGTDPAYHFNVGYALWRKGDFDAAAMRFRAVLERNPEDAEAANLLARCEKRTSARRGEPHTDGLERVKTNYEESAYRQLKAALPPDKP